MSGRNKMPGGKYARGAGPWIVVAALCLGFTGVETPSLGDCHYTRSAHVCVAVYMPQELVFLHTADTWSLVMLTVPTHRRCSLLYDELTWGRWRTVARGTQNERFDTWDVDPSWGFCLFLRPVGLRLSLHQKCYGRGYMRRLTWFSASCILPLLVLTDACFSEFLLFGRALASMIAWPLLIAILICALCLLWLFHLTRTLIKISGDAALAMWTSGLCEASYTETYDFLFPRARLPRVAVQNQSPPLSACRLAGPARHLRSYDPMAIEYP